jgi:formylglycine-generating enzyme required for sulfatase activity
MVSSICTRRLVLRRRSTVSAQARAVTTRARDARSHAVAGERSLSGEVGEPDERPVHEVHVSAFDLDLTEVIVAEYAKCVRAGGCEPAPIVIQFPGVTSLDQQLFDSECNDDRSDRQDHAENCVDWSMADAYCRWAGKRLPTEEEWEYAACGGNCEQALGRRGGAATILSFERWPFSSFVARTSPGSFGLYDMACNVWEWTASPYCPYEHLGCEDPRRVVRGGSWSMEDIVRVRLTDRAPSHPSTRNPNLGFRCARSSS